MWLAHAPLADGGAAALRVAAGPGGVRCPVVPPTEATLCWAAGNCSLGSHGQLCLRAAGSYGGQSLDCLNLRNRFATLSKSLKILLFIAQLKKAGLIELIDFCIGGQNFNLLFPVAFCLAAVLCRFNRTLQQVSRNKPNHFIGLLQCRLQPGTGMVLAKYHLCLQFITSFGDWRRAVRCRCDFQRRCLVCVEKLSPQSHAGSGTQAASHLLTEELALCCCYHQ